MILRVVAWGIACFVLPAIAAAPEAPAGAAPKRTKLEYRNEAFTGDLDEMVKRREIRVLTVYGKTNFFVDKGTQRGLVHDAMKQFEEEFNKRIKSKNLRVHMTFIPVSRDKLLSSLVAGKGDIAAANLTITEARDKVVDFTDPWVRDVKELVVTGEGSPEIAKLDDLSGKEVFVRRSSSYFESLTALNAGFAKRGLAEVKLVLAPETFEDEDLLEMLNAGLVKVVIMDSHKAALWRQVFPKLKVHDDLAVRTGGAVAWAVRENNPALKAELNAFIARNGANTAFGAEIFRRYLKSLKYVKSATSEAELKKFRALVGLFRESGNKYGMDWMLMMAQGYQESRLDQDVKSPVGAIGVMQIMPATAQDLKVGDVTRLEPNIEGGVKYMRFVIDQFYAKEPMDDLNKGLFAFAAYNAGPGRIAGLRRDAAKRGLDPNVWFNNVEVIASEKIGRETVTYVANIYKYYIAYTLSQGEYLDREKAKVEFKAVK